MSLNIKNEHVHALARQAAELTGGSQTSAVERALEELIARHTDNGEAERARMARIQRILDRMHAEIADGPPLMDHNDLYDENGLPA